MKRDPSVLRLIPKVTSEELTRNNIDRHMEGFRSIYAIKEALDLGLFEILQDWKGIDDLAKEMGLDRNLLGHLCEALHQLCFLDRDGISFRNTEGTNDFLLKSSPMSQMNGLSYRLDSVLQMSMLDSALKGDRKELKSDMFTDRWISMIGEGAIGGPIGMTLECIESFIDMGEIRSWLDLGGGHGLYSIAMAYSHPNIRCSVFDQPSITPTTKRFSEEYGVDIDVQTGDFYKDKVEGTYDIVFSSYNRSCSDPVLIPMIVSILNKGGYYIIRRPKDNRYWDPLFSLQRAIVSDIEFTSDTPQGEDFLRLLEETGLKRLQSKIVGGSEVIIYGRQ